MKRNKSEKPRKSNGSSMYNQRIFPATITSCQNLFILLQEKQRRVLWIEKANIKLIRNTLARINVKTSKEPHRIKFHIRIISKNEESIYKIEERSQPTFSRYQNTIKNKFSTQYQKYTRNSQVVCSPGWHRPSLPAKMPC